jgi:hypothetical protein
MTLPKNTRIKGYYPITEVEPWDQVELDAEDDPFIRFERDGGEFQFGCVCGDMDCEHTTRDGKPAVEWSWTGNVEEDDVTGRGWAVLQADGSLVGRIYFHEGDSVGFTAAWKPKGQKV